MRELLSSSPAVIRLLAWTMWAALFSASAAAESQVRSKAVYPAVIPADYSSGALVLVRTDAPASSVMLELAAGGSVTFLQINSMTFSATLTPEQLLFHYAADDVNRNFVGHLKVTTVWPSSVATSNFFVNVDDLSIADVDVKSPAKDMRCAPHVVNLDIAPETGGAIWEPIHADVRPVLHRFYTVFGDDYDFVNVVLLRPDLTANSDHIGVRNDVHGIGSLIFDNTADYASAGALRGITRFPIDVFFDLAAPAAQHELGHQWISRLHDVPLLGGGAPHWPPSEPGRGLMGVNIGNSSVGGLFGFAFTPLGGNLYTLTPAPPLGMYTPLDLYLMGFLSAHEVSPFVILDPPDQPLVAGSTVTATTRGINTVIGVVGPRAPNVAFAPKHFRMATIVVTRTGLLTDRELALFDHFAARGEATAPLAYASGFEKGQANPFAVATLGLGSLDTSLTCPATRIDLPLDRVGICKTCPPAPCLSCPGLIRGIDLAIYPEVSDRGVLTRLHTKLVAAGEAYNREQLQVAATSLRSFLNEIAAQRGVALTKQAADAVTALTIQVATLLRIPLTAETR